nr:ABC transporter ATP-binding protein/permease [Oscillospiraceae bacterium]
RFIRNCRFDLQTKMLENYIYRPYEFFLNVESGEIIRVINDDTTYSYDVLLTLLSLLSEMIVSLAVVFAVFYISPAITIGMAIIIVILIVIIISVVRPILYKITVEKQASGADRTKWLLQSIQGIKELKVMQREQYFVDEFSKSGKVYIEALSKTVTLSQAPAFLIEAIAMSSFMMALAVMIGVGTDLEAIVPVLSVVAMASLRLLPAANKISRFLGNLASEEPYLDKTIEQMRAMNSFKKQAYRKTSAMKQVKESVALVNVHYHYPERESDVLAGASMKFSVGESVGIIGPSGSGKTTAIDILLGLLHPQKGDVLVDGMSIQADYVGWISQIAYIPQTIFILDGTIRENVAFGVPPEEVDEDRVLSSLRDASLMDFVDSLPEGTNTQLGERGVRLSGGQRQRIGIARALYADRDVLFFDEATSSLDTETETEIMNAINHLRGRKTLVIIAHRLSTIEDCDHLFRVEKGEIKQIR